MSTYFVKQSSFWTPWGVRYFRRVEERTTRNMSHKSRSGYGDGRDYSSKSVSASSYSCYKAHYPLLYEILKSPKAARKNFKDWKASVEQLPSENRPALPPQELTFTELKPMTDKRGDILVLSCILQPTYPCFSLECTTEFTERLEVRNGRAISDVRRAGALISTTANSWRIVFELIGWNSDVLRAALANDDMDMLEEAKAVRKGDSAVAPLTAQFDKKVTVPSGYELDRIWSKTKDFYNLEIYIPKRTYRHKTFDEDW
ncbi:hypothetical protein ZTR_10132 [Talaromyces verruculosus]|nr:hypothetical protein ZTR_10132 [Talaromyces verruculosus]